MLLQYFTISPVHDIQEESSSKKNYLPKTLHAKFLIMWMPISHTAHLENNTMKRFIPHY